MKVIDLLNKIANKEEIGKIKILGMEYYIDDAGKFLCDEFGRVKWCIDDEWLNVPVEIIEDKKILEELDVEDDGNTITLYDNAEWTILNNVDVAICNKINEIIEYINKGEIDEKNK